MRMQLRPVDPDYKKQFAFRRLLQLLHDAWGVAYPYWAVSEDRWMARGLLLAVVLLNLGIVFINVLLNKWNNEFYDALQYKDYKVFIHLLIQFSWLAGFYIVFAVYQLYLNQMLQIRWRRWLTDQYLRAWLTEDAYYRMQLTGDVDNPDQRIEEDVPNFISSSLTLAIGGMRAVVTLISFVAILWGLSGTLAVHLSGHPFTVPGYLVWAALLYAVAGTWLTHWIGHPLVRLNFDQQRYEADFRFSLVRFRENAEGVALYHGEEGELHNFGERFASIVRNWWDIMRQQKRLTWFTSGYTQAAVIFPIIVVAPRYFGGKILLGGLMQTAGAFGQVQDALSFVISSYTDIASWASVVDRLSEFRNALERTRIQASADDGIHRANCDASLNVNGVNLDLPDGQPLIANVNVSLGRGDSALLRGPSGTGKSTLFRAIAGIWPFGRGEIQMPPNARVLFLPQKPYLPIGTLRESVSYPMPADDVDEAILRDALEAVELPELAGRLGEGGHWTLQLSPGEQQRIAFARALVQKPEWLFLDEATSAVDEETESRLYRLLRDRLPGTTVFSVGHRETLRAFHSRQLVLQPDGNGPASIVETPVEEITR
jgi:vitamin B12/bleomycin/antimicrobial peptide transport system ATP-binding/permease protein